MIPSALIPSYSLQDLQVSRPRASHTRPDRVTVAIISYVAMRFDMTPWQLKAKGKQPALTTPRHIAMFLACERGASQPEVGFAFGGFHHTTVLHAIRKIEREVEVNSELRRFLDEAREALKDFRPGKMRIPPPVVQESSNVA